MQLGHFSNSLNDYRALLPYSLLGLIAGICSAFAVLAFDFLITFAGEFWLGTASPEGFESLADWQRFALPVAGAALLGLVFTLLAPTDRETGIVHVLSRMHSHYGQLPLRNTVVQLLGGAFALATGQSGGREGPGVHLGAAINSTIGTRLNLPNNSLRILIAAGTAGSIAAAFNTPLAGVVFAMEVIVAEYTVVGFTPVILAAVSATIIRQALWTSGATLAVPAVALSSLLELPFILLIGIVCGAITSLFVVLLKRSLRFSQYPVFLRFTCAGLITGCLAVWVPEVMGMGYDSLNRALLGEMAPLALLALVACKLVATAGSVGLGMPVGLIGPNLLIGACLGGLLGFFGTALLPGLSSDVSLYVVIGMGASMAAVLNAPLAGILAIVELTRNVHIVFPSMLAIIAACLTNTIVFGQRSAHQSILRHLQREIPDDPVSQLLHQTSVVPVMDRDVKVMPPILEAQDLPDADARWPRWCLLHREGDPLFLVRGEDVAAALRERETSEECDLTELDIRRWTVASLSPRSTLREALDTLRSATAEAVIIAERGAPESAVRGILTRETIDQFYLGRI
jgi:H+/Cl- antiporter ClcA